MPKFIIIIVQKFWYIEKLIQYIVNCDNCTLTKEKTIGITKENKRKNGEIKVLVTLVRQRKRSGDVSPTKKRGQRKRLTVRTSASVRASVLFCRG